MPAMSSLRLLPSFFRYSSSSISSFPALVLLFFLLSPNLGFLAAAQSFNKGAALSISTSLNSTASITTATTAPTTLTTSVSLTPEMSASSISSVFASLATSSPDPGLDPTSGDVDSSGVDNNAGASGTDSESFNMSKGALIALIVIIVCVVAFAIASATLYYLAKKRSWEVRKTIRRSARRVATALTPRRSEFPKDFRRSSKGLEKIDEVPPTPKYFKNRDDIEKAEEAKIGSFEMEQPKNGGKWGRKIGP